jgi:hypothetical protein
MSSAPPPHGEWVEPGEGVPRSLRGMRAYLPRPLPSDVILPTETHRVLASVEHALGRLDEAAQRLPDRAGFVLSGQLRDAQSSAQLSGESAALVESWVVRLLLAREAEGAGGSVRAILADHPVGRFIAASEHGARRVREGARIDAALLGEISAQLTGSGPRSLEEGLRTHQGWLGGRSPEDAYVLTTPPGGLLVSTLAQWSTWVCADHPLPRVGKIALAHLHLELLQPYPEANGHLARLYSAFELVRLGLLRDQVLPISVWLDRHRDAYHRHVLAVVEGGPIADWIRFFAEGVEQLALEHIRLVDDLDRLRAELVELARKTSPSAQRVVKGLVTAPVTSHHAAAGAAGHPARAGRPRVQQGLRLRRGARPAGPPVAACPAG